MEWYEIRALQQSEEALGDKKELCDALTDLCDRLADLIDLASEEYDHIHSGRPSDRVGKLLRQLTLLPCKSGRSIFKRLCDALQSMKSVELDEAAVALQRKAQAIRSEGFSEKEKALMDNYVWKCDIPGPGVSELPAPASASNGVKVRDIKVCLEIYRDYALELCRRECSAPSVTDDTTPLENYQPVSVQALDRSEAQQRTSHVSGGRPRRGPVHCGGRFQFEHPVQLLTRSAAAHHSSEYSTYTDESACDDYIRSCMVLSGPGTGKTTVCRKILAAYTSTPPEPLLTKRCPYPVYIRCQQDMARFHADSWMGVLGLKDKALRDQLSDEERSSLEKYFLANSKKLFFIIDGADEVDGVSFLPESAVLGKTLLCREREVMLGSLMLVTSRPCPQASKLVEACTAWYSLAGFEPQQLLEYLRHRLSPSRGDKCFASLSQSGMASVKAAIMAVPMFASLLAQEYLYNQTDSIPPTVSALYLRYTSVSVKRLEDRDQDKNRGVASQSYSRQSLSSLLEDPGGEELPSREELCAVSYGQVFCGLQQLSYQQLCNMPVTEDYAKFEDIRQFGQDIGMLLVPGKSNRKKLQFKHITYQDFLAAREVVSHSQPVAEVRRCLDAFGVSEKTWHFWRCLCGLMKASQVSTVLQVLLESGSVADTNRKKLLCFVMQCLQENQPQDSEDRVPIPVEDCKWLSEKAFKNEIDLSQYRLSLVDVTALNIGLALLPIEKLLLKSCGLEVQHIHALCQPPFPLCRLTHIDLSGNNLQGKLLETFTRSLWDASECRVTNLNLAHCDLQGDDGKAIAKCLQLRSVTDVMLSGMDPSTLPVLAEAMVECPNLHRLALDQCGFAAGSGVHLQSILLKATGLCNLFLRSNKLTSSDANLILRVFTKLPDLHYVWLQRNMIDDQITPELIQLLKEYDSCQGSGLSAGRNKPKICIGLECNQVTRICLDAIMEDGLSHCCEVLVGEHYIQLGEFKKFNVHAEMERSLGSLSLRGISDDICKGIAKYLEADRFTDDILDLKVNQISDRGVSYLAYGLTRTKKVKVLDLACNKIGLPGFLDLMPNLCGDTSSVNALAIGENPIFEHESTPSAPRYNFGKHLGSDRCLHLRALLLNATNMTDDVGIGLAEAFKWNRSVKMLSVATNQLGNEFVGALCCAFDDNNGLALKMLSLSKNRITNKGVECLVKCKRLQQLECVWMHGNPCSPHLYRHPLLDGAFAFVSSDLLDYVTVEATPPSLELS